MKQGPLRFDFYITQLQNLLIKASTQKNPSMWLYKNNARTSFFMLEGLAKLYCGLHNKKRFEKIKGKFKIVEDLIGAIDYYYAFANELSKNKKIPLTVIKYIQSKTIEKTTELNAILIDDKWLGKTSIRLEKIKNKLGNVDWKNPVKEINAINDFYGSAILDIVSFIQSLNYNFTNIEEQVHEIRRKLRWLSIYPQALQGCIQLSNSNKKNNLLKKYLTKEIINSPFNKLPDALDNTIFLLLNTNYFYALSWIIAELGKLKDSGLKVNLIKEALLQTNNAKTEKEALSKTYTLLGKNQPSLSEILKTASKICKTYFTENNLENLILGIGKI